MTGREIERKFLVAGAPDGLDLGGGDRVEQGYVATGTDEVRVRKLGERTFLTVKRGSGEVRSEEEVELSREQFERLWPLTEGRRVHKVRHRLGADGGTIELDVYGGPLDGLVTAEIEFDDEDQAAAFEPPEWFGAEVTFDERYKNESLATRGLPD